MRSGVGLSKALCVASGLSCWWWRPGDWQQADEAYRLGPPLATQSYLRGDIILEVAKHCGAQVCATVDGAVAV